MISHLCLICVLFGCSKESSTKQSIQRNENSASAQSVTIDKPVKTTTAESVIGKKIWREPAGPDDTANFKIELLPDGMIKGNADGSISGATGILYFGSGKWKFDGDFIKVELSFKGKISQPTADSYVQAQKIQNINFTIMTKDIESSSEEYYVLTSEIEYN